MFDFSNYSAKWKYYNYSNALVIDKMKDELGGVATEEFVDSSEYEKAKGVNNNFVAKIGQNEYKASQTTKNSLSKSKTCEKYIYLRVVIFTWNLKVYIIKSKIKIS